MRVSSLQKTLLLLSWKRHFCSGLCEKMQLRQEDACCYEEKSVKYGGENSGESEGQEKSRCENRGEEYQVGRKRCCIYVVRQYGICILSDILISFVDEINADYFYIQRTGFRK